MLSDQAQARMLDGRVVDQPVDLHRLVDAGDIVDHDLVAAGQGHGQQSLGERQRGDAPAGRHLGERQRLQSVPGGIEPDLRALGKGDQVAGAGAQIGRFHPLLVPGDQHHHGLAADRVGGAARVGDPDGERTDGVVGHAEAEGAGVDHRQLGGGLVVDLYLGQLVQPGSADADILAAVEDEAVVAGVEHSGNRIEGADGVDARIGYIGQTTGAEGGQLAVADRDAHQQIRAGHGGKTGKQEADFIRGDPDHVLGRHDHPAHHDHALLVEVLAGDGDLGPALPAGQRRGDALDDRQQPLFGGEAEAVVAIQGLPVYVSGGGRDDHAVLETGDKGLDRPEQEAGALVVDLGRDKTGQRHPVQGHLQQGVAPVGYQDRIQDAVELDLHRRGGGKHAARLWYLSGDGDLPVGQGVERTDQVPVGAGFAEGTGTHRRLERAHGHVDEIGRARVQGAAAGGDGLDRAENGVVVAKLDLLLEVQVEPGTDVEQLQVAVAAGHVQGLPLHGHGPGIERPGLDQIGERKLPHRLGAGAGSDVKDHDRAGGPGGYEEQPVARQDVGGGDGVAHRVDGVHHVADGVFALHQIDRHHLLGGRQHHPEGVAVDHHLARPAAQILGSQPVQLAQGVVALDLVDADAAVAGEVEDSVPGLDGDAGIGLARGVQQADVVDQQRVGRQGDVEVHQAVSAEQEQVVAVKRQVAEPVGREVLVHAEGPRYAGYLLLQQYRVHGIGDIRENELASRGRERRLVGSVLVVAFQPAAGGGVEDLVLERHGGDRARADGALGQVDRSGLLVGVEIGVGQHALLAREQGAGYGHVHRAEVAGRYPDLQVSAVAQNEIAGRDPPEGHHQVAVEAHAVEADPVAALRGTGGGVDALQDHDRLNHDGAVEAAAHPGAIDDQRQRHGVSRQVERRHQEAEAVVLQLENVGGIDRLVADPDGQVGNRVAKAAAADHRHLATVGVEVGARHALGNLAHHRVDDRAHAADYLVGHVDAAGQVLPVEPGDGGGDDQPQGAPVHHPVVQGDVHVGAGNGVPALDDVLPDVERRIGVVEQLDRLAQGRLLGIDQLVELYADGLARGQGRTGLGQDRGDDQVGRGRIGQPRTVGHEERPLVRPELAADLVLPVAHLVAAQAVVGHHRVVAVRGDGHLPVLDHEGGAGERVGSGELLHPLDGIGGRTAEAVEDHQVQVVVLLEQNEKLAVLPLDVDRLTSQLVARERDGGEAHGRRQLGVGYVKETDEPFAQRVGHRHGQHLGVLVQRHVGRGVAGHADVVQNVGRVELDDADDHQPVAAAGQVDHVVVHGQAVDRLVGARLREPNRSIPDVDVVDLQAGLHQEAVGAAGRVARLDAYVEQIAHDLHGAYLHGRVVGKVDAAPLSQGVGEVAHQHLLAAGLQIDLVDIRAEHAGSTEGKAVQIQHVVLEVGDVHARRYLDGPDLVARPRAQDDLGAGQYHPGGGVDAHGVAAQDRTEVERLPEEGRLQRIAHHHRARQARPQLVVLHPDRVLPGVDGQQLDGAGRDLQGVFVDKGVRNRVGTDQHGHVLVVAESAAVDEDALVVPAVEHPFLHPAHRRPARGRCRRPDVPYKGHPLGAAVQVVRAADLDLVLHARLAREGDAEAVRGLAVRV